MMQQDFYMIDHQMTEIEQERYAGSEVERVVIPAGVRRIGAAAFMDCALLREVIFEAPSQLEEIGDGAFSGCAALHSVCTKKGEGYGASESPGEDTNPAQNGLPDGLRSIGEMAFFGSGLRQVVVPASVEEIGEMAFWDCAALTKVDVLGEKTGIGKDAFGCCPRLAEGFLAPGFPRPKDATPPAMLLSAILWCTCPARHGAETSERALAYIWENEDAVLSKIIAGNMRRALRGLLAAAPAELTEKIRRHADRYLGLCAENGASKELQAIFLEAFAGFEHNRDGTRRWDEEFEL